MNPYDIDELRDAFGMTSSNPRYGFFNLKGTGSQINDRDRNYFVHRILDTCYGDANWDGEFNSADFVQVSQAGSTKTSSRTIRRGLR